jgi:hypothetical protein
MKKITTMICTGLALLGCAEDDLKLYNGRSAIYFEALEVNTGRILDTIDFGFGPTPLVEVELALRVKATGDVMDTDRRFKVKVENTDDATPGIDFDVDSSFTFPAGAPEAAVAVKLYRGPEDDDTTRFVTLRLVPNEHFDTSLPYRYRTTTDSVDVTRMTVQFTSAMPRPQYYMEVVMGYFSVDKLLLVNELCNLTYAQWTVNIPPMQMIGYGQALKNYLQYRISLGPDMAIKDPSPKSHRGYMCIGTSSYVTPDVVIPSDWPDAPQRAK